MKTRIQLAKLLGLLAAVSALGLHLAIAQVDTNGCPLCPGYALSFNGADGYVQVPGALTNAPTTEITVEFWQKVNAPY